MTKTIPSAPFPSGAGLLEGKVQGRLVVDTSG